MATMNIWLFNGQTLQGIAFTGPGLATGVDSVEAQALIDGGYAVAAGGEGDD